MANEQGSGGAAAKSDVSSLDALIALVTAFTQNAAAINAGVLPQLALREVYIAKLWQSSARQNEALVTIRQHLAELEGQAQAMASRTADNPDFMTQERTSASGDVLRDADLSTTPSGAAGFAALLMGCRQSLYDSDTRALVVLTETDSPTQQHL